MFDRLNQLVIIFYLDTKVEEFKLEDSPSFSEIVKIFEAENCIAEIAKHKNNSLTLTIPSYHLLEE